jgi:predicted nucleic acid-binding protein
MLLDTTFFIDLEEEVRTGKPGECASFIRFHRHVAKQVSVVTIGEFAVGATAAATLRFFRGYRRLSLGRDLAIFAGRLQAGLPFELGENDLWIAATARFHDLPLGTRDLVFPKVPGLKVIPY